MKLYIEKTEMRSAGILRDAFAVVDEEGRLASMGYPSRYLAAKVRDELVDEIADYEIGKGKRPQRKKG